MESPDARILIKTILLAIGLAFELPEIAARIAMLGLSSGLLLYVGLYGVLAFCLWSAALIRFSLLRWGWALILALATVLVGSFQQASADALSYDAFVTLIYSAGFAGDAVVQHAASLAWALIGALFLFIGVGLRPGPTRLLPGAAAVLAPVAGLAMLSVLLFIRGGDGARGLPRSWIGTAYSVLYAYDAATLPSLSRQTVSIAHSRKSEQGDIILIIDESIAGRYLDINDAAGVRSGLASPPTGVFVSNFGLAASITNCSFGSNLSLRHGGTRDGYQHASVAMPSIYAYAKQAGFDTVYVDAQRVGGAYQNGMDAAEGREIDRFIQYKDVPVVDRDMAVADTLIAALGNQRREFILVNKMGAHFPVADKYPDSANIFSPALPRNRAAVVTETMLPANLYTGAENWRRYRNAYRNTVAWTVGGFFDRLFARARLDGALIIYTSDHGQDLHERGDPGTTTHCSPVPASEEGAVPLAIIDTSGRWTAAAKRNFDASSHYRIFPTLLTAMGYDPVAVRQSYGEALDSWESDPVTFNSLYNARLGHKPQWVEVRRASVAQPPVSDYVPRKNGAAPR